MPANNSAHRAVRGRHSRIRRSFGDGLGPMTDVEWREAWEREVWPRLVPGCIGFVLGALALACLQGVL